MKEIILSFWLTWLAVGIPAFGADAGVSPAEYLAGQPKPHFHEGHTLPPLTRFGWTLPVDARVALAEDWGYALEFGGYATEWRVEKDLANPNSAASRLCALSASNPKKYPLAVIVSREMPTDVPPETWTRDAEGHRLDPEGDTIPEKGREARAAVWSPEAPDAVFQEAADLRTRPLRKILERCPIAVVLNGGEYGLGVLGFLQPVWSKDPRVLAAKGDQPWFDYISECKAHQEMIISGAIRRAVPNRVLYSFYTAGGGIHRNRTDNWRDWCWGYEWMQPVSDLPSNEAYYRSFNDGWIGAKDMLTLALNAAAREIAHGQPLSYNWLCAGWPREVLKEDGGLGDLTRYMGFLKCYYTAGMIGGNAGYYAYPEGGFVAHFPPRQPPHWLRQIIVLSRVHALFSHLEPFLREGDLLPGPNRHRYSKDLPAYEFPSDDQGARVLARRLKAQPIWMLTAWAAEGPDREVRVNIPELGQVSVLARACGTVSLARLNQGKSALTLLDSDGSLPTKEAGRLEAETAFLRK